MKKRAVIFTNVIALFMVASAVAAFGYLDYQQGNFILNANISFVDFENSEITAEGFNFNDEVIFEAQESLTFQGGASASITLNQLGNSLIRISSDQVDFSVDMQAQGENLFLGDGKIHVFESGTEMRFSNSGDVLSNIAVGGLYVGQEYLATNYIPGGVYVQGSFDSGGPVFIKANTATPGNNSLMATQEWVGTMNYVEEHDHPYARATHEHDFAEINHGHYEELLAKTIPLLVATLDQGRAENLKVERLEWTPPTATDTPTTTLSSNNGIDRLVHRTTTCPAGYYVYRIRIEEGNDDRGYHQVSCRKFAAE